MGREMGLKRALIVFYGTPMCCGMNMDVKLILCCIFFFHSAEIIMLDGLTCVYRSNVDLFFYVMGSSNENEVRVINEVLSKKTLVAQAAK